MRKTLFSIIIGVLALVLAATVTTAAATNGDSTVRPVDCVPSDAWTETIEHPAVTHEETITVVDQEAWTETIPGEPGQHYSWTGGKRDTDDPPTVVPPHDDWQANTQHEPHNSATWVNANLHYTSNSGQHRTGGGSHASWFYFVHPTEDEVIEHPAITHEETIVVTDEEAWTETIEHPAVECPDDPTDPPTDPPVTEEPPTEEPPTEEPPVSEPEETGTASVTRACIGDTLVIKETDAEGNSNTSHINGSPACKTEEPVKEEGF